MHALDGRKVRRLAKDIFELCEGRPMTREDLRRQLAQLMVCVRADCNAAGADAVLDDLLASVDHYTGAGPLEALIEEAISGSSRRVTLSPSP